jgi:polysaccharide biosynthesis transport protein
LIFGISMLQLNKAQSEVNRQPAVSELLSAAESLKALASFGRRQFPVIAFVTLLATALGVIYCVTARPSFTAQAQLMIDARKVQVFQQQSIFGDIPIDTAQVESQVEVLKSENIASAVIKNLHLNENPEFVGSNGGLLGALFSLVFPASESEQANSEFESFRRAMSAFKNELNVKRIGLTYVIQINFRSYDAEQAAQIANAVADAYIVDQLEAKYQATRRASTWLQDRIKELRDQVSSAERAVVEFKTKNNIVSTGGAGSDKRLLGEQQVTELSSQLVIARAHTAEAKARLDRIDAVLKADSPNESFGATVADTLKSDIVSKLRSQYLELAAREADWSARYGKDHLAVVNLRMQMREIRNSIFQELKRLGETYKSDYEIAKQREAGVQKELAYAVTQSQATDTASISLRELESTAQTYKTLYDNFLQRYMESVQQQSFPITEARLISTATRPLKKSSPKTLIVLAITGFGGMILGFGIGMIRDLSDRVFRTSEQVENLLETDCLALVPLLTDDDTINASSDLSRPMLAQRVQNRRDLSAKTILARCVDAIRSTVLVSDLYGTIRSTRHMVASLTPSPSNESRRHLESMPESTVPSLSAELRTIVRSDNTFWPVVDAPLSRFTESIRSIKAASELNGMLKANRVIGFTSSLPNEGKSTVALALAQLMSQVNARTILVDCDLRNPSLSRALAPSAKSGMLEIIGGKATLEEVIWLDRSINLAFLPAVVRSRLAHSNEILNSTHVKKLFEELRGRYDYVVVDFPPLAPIVDVRTATHLVDSFIFVVEWGRTKFDIVEHALGGARGVYENLLGVVLNKVDMNVFGRYANYQGEYYFNKHYERYGYTN